MLQQVDEIEAVPLLEAAEIHDDVVALRDRVGGHLAVLEVDRVLHDVAVVGDHVEGDRLSRLIDQGDLDVARDAAVQQAEAVAARAHLDEGLELPVHRHAVSQKTIAVEDVEIELTLVVPGLVGDQEIHVVVAIAPVECGTARETKVDTVHQSFIAAIEGAVVVHHRGAALVDVLRRVVEHVIVEPVRAHRLAVVTGNPSNPSVTVRRTRPRVTGIRVDAVMPGQNHGPAVVEVLAGKEEGLGVTVTLERIVAVVLVGAEGMQPEAVVRRGIDGQRVVVTEENRLAVASLEELRREGAVEGPDRVRILERQVGVHPHVDTTGGALRVVETVGPEFSLTEAVHLEIVPDTTVHTRPRGGGVEVDLGLELVPTLVREGLARRAALCSRVTQRPAQGLLDPLLPGIRICDVGHAARKGK